ncbi:hypothetical protein PIB30_065229 [Stylosanthes scabra]|uniref:Uncharacterized protein n=1 Tax=Stylosanthes scabra TaxID=79078 RepID=A0ABU6WKB2_9FABA|nr:hypothetical protein [Stylosanthes scabra]
MEAVEVTVEGGSPPQEHQADTASSAVPPNMGYVSDTVDVSIEPPTVNVRSRARGVIPEPSNRDDSILDIHVHKLKSNVTSFTRKILVLLKWGRSPKSVSPVVGSNSGHAGYNPTGGCKTEQPGLATRISNRGLRTPTSDGSDDPDYLLIETTPRYHLETMLSFIRIFCKLGTSITANGPGK